MTNALEVVCPRCGRGDLLDVEFTGVCRLTADGSEDIGDHSFDDNSQADCQACGWSGVVGSLREAGQ